MKHPKVIDVSHEVVITPKGSVVIDFAWAIESCGFGHFVFEFCKGGKMVIDTECMDNDTIKGVLNAWVDKVLEYNT